MQTLSVPYELAFGISEVAHDDGDEVDQSPDTASAACEELRDSCACLSDIESVNTKVSYKETEEQGYQPVLAASVYCCRGRSVYCTSAFYAYDSIVVDLCATITAIHCQVRFKG